MEYINNIITFSQQAIKSLENLLSYSWGKDFFSPLITAILGSFFGAFAAFYLERWAKKKEEDKTNIAAGNLALSMLLLQIDTLARYKRDVIMPALHNIEKENHLIKLLTMQSSLDFELNNLNFDIKSLQFLLKEDKTIIVELLRQQINFYQETIRLINARSKHTIEKVQEKIDNFLKLSPHSGISLDELKSCLSKIDYGHLESYTVNIVDLLEKTLVNTLTCKQQLQKVLFKIYKEENFIKFSLNNSDLT